MRYNVSSFFEGMKGKEIGFIGAGVSHLELIELMAAKGAVCTLRDKRSEQELGEVFTRLQKSGVKMILGKDYLEGIAEEVIFRTPGMNYTTPQLKEAKERGVVITSEMEVFFSLCPCEIIGVTGSDGKTTTTTLIGEILKAEGYTVHVGGNIGRALLPIIEQIKGQDKVVVELSSFQLISMRQSPDIAVITNVQPNHLDVHADMEEYVGAKRNIMLHQSGFSKTVLNADNRTTLRMREDVRGEAVLFSRKSAVRTGVFADDKGKIYHSKNGKTTFIMDSSLILMPGEHNLENYLGAIAAVWGMVSVDSIQKVAESFGGVEHRIELVRILDGVRWYNDSIATSPTRTMAALKVFDTKAVIIAGGYDKNIPFEPMVPLLLEKASCLVLMGTAAQKINTAVVSADGFAQSGIEVVFAQSMEEAVSIAREKAATGGIVSLSPACASFDAYKNFEERGNHYKTLVRAL